jgi:hypothetical protein
VKLDNESLLAQADAMATAAKDYEPALIARGLAADFVPQLRDAVEMLRTAIDARGAAVALRHKAGETLSELVKRGVRIVNTLTVVVQRTYRNDSATLAEWKQLRRVTQRGPRLVTTALPAVESAVAVVKATSAVAQGDSAAVKTDAEVPNIAPPVTTGASEVPKAAAA